mgnify:FL=1|jgi:hypothetical protein
MTEETVAPDDSGQVAEETSSFEFNSSTMPEGLRDEPSLKSFDTVDKLAKSYVNAVKMIGGKPENLVQLPQEGENRESIWNQMGRPEQPNGYDFTEFSGEDDTELDGFREFAHDSGFTQEQANNILNLYSNILEEESNASTQQVEDQKVQTEIDLQREWGKNYDGKLDYAKRAFGQIGTPELSKLMDESGMGNHPEVIRAFSRVGEMLGEDSLVIGSGLGGKQTSPEDAKNKIQGLYKDKEFSEAYRDNRNPNHKTAMNTMDKLFKQAYQGQGRVR